MTEGIEHLIETYRTAGLVTSDAPCGWGYTMAEGNQSTTRITVIYMIMSRVPDDHGRVLAQRWGYQDEHGRQTPARGLIATPTKISNFDMIKGMPW